MTADLDNLRINPRPQLPPGAESEEGGRRARTASLRERLPAIVTPAIVVLVLLGAWELATVTGWQPPYLLPSPTAVAESLWTERDAYWSNAVATLTEVFVGFTLGALLGCLFGIGIGLVAGLRRAFYPLLVASQSLPVLALAPLLVLWFGFGIVPKLIIIVQIVFFPVTVATISGLLSVSEEALVFGRSLGARWSALFFKVRLPASLPFIFSGLKISASYAAIAAVIAEWAGSEKGLGAMMLRANTNLQTEIVFGTLVLITLIGLGAFGLMVLLERIFVPWHERFRR